MFWIAQTGIPAKTQQKLVIPPVPYIVSGHFLVETSFQTARKDRCAEQTVRAHGHVKTMLSLRLLSMVNGSCLALAYILALA